MTAAGPICKACTKLVDVVDAQEIKLDFNRIFARDEEHATRFCETVGCWGIVRKADWDTKRCHAFLTAGDSGGCNVPGAGNGLKREATVPDSKPHAPLRAYVADSFTLFEAATSDRSAAAAPPPPPPPVVAKVADVRGHEPAAAAAKAADVRGHEPAAAAKMRSTYEGLMNRLDDMKMGLHDLKDDLCDFYEEYVAVHEEHGPLDCGTTVSDRGSSLGSLVQTDLPQEAPAHVHEGQVPRSRSRHRKRKVRNDAGGHVDLLSTMMSLPAAPHNSQLKNAWL